MSLKQRVLLSFFLIYPVVNYASTDMSVPAIRDRIKPVGNVVIEPPSNQKPPAAITTPSTQTVTPSSIPKPATVTPPATNSPAPPPAATTPASAPQAVTSSVGKGPAIYQQYCKICHETGVNGAPKLGDAAEWNKRKQQGIDQLVAHVVKGYNLMPPRGTCFNCSEQDLRDAVNYMLGK